MFYSITSEESQTRGGYVFNYNFNLKLLKHFSILKKKWYNLS